MGYSNRFTGAITITPPLTWSDIQNGPKLQDVQLRVREEKRTAVVDGAEAEVIVRTADAIVPLDMEYSGHQLEGDIQAVIDHYEGYGFAGFIEAQWDPGFGEPPSRFIAKNGRVMRIDAQYRWPGIWPDEQDDPFAMVAEDCPAGPARAVVEHWFSHAALISDSVESPEWHAVAGMTRRVLDLMDAEQGGADEQPQGGRNGYAVRLLDMLESDPDRFQESEEEDLRAALSALFRCTAEAANLATALVEAQAERDGATQAVAEAVSILEGMLNEDAWAYDAGRARNVLLDYFARDLDALNVRDAKAGE